MCGAIFPSGLGPAHPMGMEFQVRPFTLTVGTNTGLKSRVFTGLWYMSDSPMPSLKHQMMVK